MSNMNESELVIKFLLQQIADLNLKLAMTQARFAQKEQIEKLNKSVDLPMREDNEEATI